MSSGSAKSEKGGKGPAVPHDNVGREEFNEVRDTVAELGRTVAQVVEVTKGHATMLSKIDSTLVVVAEKLSAVASNQSESRGQRGTITINNLWHGFSALAVVVGIAAAVIMFAIRAQSAETTVKHMWISDVVNLNSDWEYRTRDLEIKPPAYQPLQGFGHEAN